MNLINFSRTTKFRPAVVKSPTELKIEELETTMAAASEQIQKLKESL